MRVIVAGGASAVDEAGKLDCGGGVVGAGLVDGVETTDGRRVEDRVVLEADLSVRLPIRNEPMHPRVKGHLR